VVCALKSQRFCGHVVDIILFTVVISDHKSLMKMANEPTTMDMSESGSDSDSNQDENEDGSPMMSIFASYYGIEEPVDDSVPKGTIDDSNFQSDSYVKVRCCF
jgi:hypothetical protein